MLLHLAQPSDRNYSVMPQDIQLSTLFHCVYRLDVHLVLVTKYRRWCLTAAVLARLEEIADATAGKWGCELREMNGEADHVHMLLGLTPTVQPSRFINNLKTVTSRLLRKEFVQHFACYYRKPVLWSRSYCLLSCGGAPLEVIKQYIENQERPG